ncbi:MAG: carbohydrate ABC transporter permease [Clostridia bacterium]|nr:carbohydrate ABC transporter permease [Clostridia bacterium]MBO4883726.1 carbohydrate ABC transporter permease [Clostridia bacterium]
MENKKTRVFYAINYILVTLVVMTMLFPLLNIIAMSFSSERAIMSNEVNIFPVEFTANTYVQVVKRTQIFRAMKNTVILTIVGTAINMFMTVCGAYALSKQRLAGRKAILMLITFTMLFGAGLIPNFILIKNLGLMNTYWALWLPGAISTYNMFVMKTFFSGIPASLEESAYIDGANDIRILISIILPLSLPALATITLFYAVGWWNAYFSLILYVNVSSKKALQQILHDLINASGVVDQLQMADSNDAIMQPIATESIKAVAIIIATMPIMCVYPFLQKYFTKGVLIGAIKG